MFKTKRNVLKMYNEKGDMVLLFKLYSKQILLNIVLDFWSTIQPCKLTRCFFDDNNLISI